MKFWLPQGPMLTKTKNIHKKKSKKNIFFHFVWTYGPEEATTSGCTAEARVNCHITRLLLTCIVHIYVILCSPTYEITEINYIKIAASLVTA